MSKTSTQTPEAIQTEATHTAVALAVAVMRKSAKAQAMAEKALDRSKGATWASVQEAAACFDATMGEAARKRLSGELAREYKKYYGSEASAVVAASQHAKAIWLIATRAGGVDPISFAGMEAYFKAVKPPRHQADAGNAPKAKPTATIPDSGEIPGIDKAADVTSKTRSAFSTAGLPVEVGSAIVRLIEAVRQNRELEDGLLFMANHAERLPEFVDYVLAQKRAATAQRLGEKFKVAKAA